MMGNPSIFAIQDRQFNFWKVDSNGLVSKSAQPYFLYFSPSGWEDISIQNIRNKNYWGIDRSVTIPLSYVNDGSKILKYIFYTLGISEPTYLVIANQQLDYTPGVSYGFWYKKIYRGEIDFSTFNHTGSKVTCTTLEDGLAKYLKSNEATVYEFPLNVPEAIYVNNDGINLHGVGHYNIIAIEDRTEDSTGYHDSKAVGVTLTGEEGDKSGITIIDENIEQFTGTNVDYINNSNNFLLRNDSGSPISFSLIGNVAFTANDITGGGSLSYELYFKKTGDNAEFVIFNDDIFNGTTYSETYNYTIVLNPNEKLFLLAKFTRSGVFPLGSITFLDNSNFDISFITRRSSTYVRTFRPQYLFEKLINKVTEGNLAAAISSYFELYKNFVFTSGNGLRGFDDATIKISWKDFFKFWNSIDAVGISVTMNKVNFDSKPNLVDDVNIIDLPEPAAETLKVTFASEYNFNELQIGYPEISNDVGALNGNEEFNDKMIFSLGTTLNPAVLDKISPIKASCYEQEKIRVTILDKTTTDYKSDNTLFVQAIESTLRTDKVPNYYNFDRSLNGTATGLFEPATVFNIPLSPKRNLLRNYQFIRSSLFMSDTTVIKFISADKNNKMIAGGLEEKADVNLGSMGTKFFLPLLFDFDIQAPDNLEDLLDLDPLQIFRWPFRGDVFTGILVKVGVSPTNKKLQTYTLMSTASNNISSLVDYYGAD